MVCMLDRPRNSPFVDEVRRTGAALRMIQDGDIAAAVAPALRTSDIDLYVGIGGAPEAVTDVYINQDLAAHVPALRPGRLTLFEQLSAAAGFRIARVEQDIRAIAAGSREAASLGIARRAPVLRIVRVYRDESGRIVEISVSSHPGDRFTYSMHIDHG
jgi:DNA-binding GntR family transcriptional regulator